MEKVLARQGRYRTVRDNLRVKEVRLESAPDLRWVLCHNPDAAARAAAQREAALDRIREELARITTARTRLAGIKPASKAAVRRRDAELAAHTRAECALRDHPALGRWLRQTSSGRLAVDTAKVRAGSPGRRVPAHHLRPRPLGRGRRAGLQEPAGGRTRLPAT